MPIHPCTRCARRPIRRPVRGGEAGYNLVILIIVMTVMNILVAASLPAWTAVIRRDKEEELIFRGLQYAEAIRLFRNRTGGLPTRLEQLIEVKPRCLRQLWKDPMTEDGKWVLIFEGQPLPAGNGGVPGNLDPNWEGGGTEIPPESLPGGPDAQGDVVAVGPIKGVRSRSKDDSFLKFDNRDRYDLWYFTVDLLNSQGIVQPPGGGAGVPTGQGLVRSVRWIGRPWPRALAGLGLPGAGGAPQFGNPQPPGGFQRPGGAQPPGGRQPGGVRQPGGARPDNR